MPVSRTRATRAGYRLLAPMEPIGNDNWIGGFGCSVGVVLIGMLAGIAIADWISSMPAQTMPRNLTDFRAETVDKSGWELFWFILRRNMTVFVMLLLGVVSAGAVTVVVLLANGIALGQLIGLAKGAGMSNAAVASLIVPHGVLELGALCVAGAVGLKGVRLAFGIRALAWESLKSLRVGTVMAFGLGALAAAAAIEAFVTVEFADSLRGQW